eukprot:TRINITY_DN6601_c0_g1_i2.p1 TRINITY_DN6601_c0_g1~~TRINITY_DN6601_c0_g1_i2.p1  ORF type:complete len:360 (-),score=119.97 TRINITY_DN6601_c0_g1_i2:47-1126(-)
MAPRCLLRLMLALALSAHVAGQECDGETGQCAAKDMEAEKANKPKAAAKPKAAKKKKSSADYLSLALRLAEATELASGLQKAGQLDSDAAKTLNDEIADIEEGINGLDDSVARDLMAMVSVVRGTLIQKTEGLTDEEVEKLGNSYTYANANYWDDYYNKTEAEERFDWYGSWDSPISFVDAGGKTVKKELGELLKPHLERDSRKILMLGCGNSDMSTKMYAAGFEDIVNIDISPKLLDELRAQHETTMPKMKWLYMNVSQLEFEDASFDVVLDKGTFDAIEQNAQLLKEAMLETNRVLKPDGVLLSTTYNDKTIRTEKQLQAAGSWGPCKTQTFQKLSHKKTGGSEEDRAYYVHACRRS